MLSLMKRLGIDKDLFSEYAQQHTLKELAEHFNISYQQAKDYCHHNHIKLCIKEFREHNCARTPQYRIWSNMVRRCYNPKSKDYKRYGGRGIKVCESWHKVENFVIWCSQNGWKQGLQLDRIDNNGDYCPENCRFVTGKENMSNRRNTIRFNGEALTKILEDEKRNPYHVERHTAWYRIRVLGWDLDKVLSTPVK